MVNEKNAMNAQKEEENVSISNYMDDGSAVHSDIYQKDKFSELYNEAINRKKRQDKVHSMQFDSDCTFQPKLISKKATPGYTNSSNGKGNSSSKHQNQSVVISS